MANTKNTGQVDKTENTGTVHTADHIDIASLEKKLQFYKKIHAIITEVERVSFDIQDFSDIYEHTYTVLHYCLKRASHKLDIIAFDLREKALTSKLELTALKKMIIKLRKSLLSAMFKLLRVYELIFIFHNRDYEDRVKRILGDLIDIDFKFEYLLKYLEQPDKNAALVNFLQSDQPYALSNNETRPKDVNQLLVHGEPHNIGHVSQNSKHQKMPNLLFHSGSENRTLLTFTVSQSMPVINPPLM